MKTDFLIVGQGICGSLLSYELKKENRSFVVIDNDHPFSASRVASGIINPVTGRRIVKTWMIDQLLATAIETYRQLEKALGIACITQKNILDFFPTLQMSQAFNKRIEEGGDFLKLPPADDQWRKVVNYEFDYGEIESCYLIDLSTLLSAIRIQLIADNSFMRAAFNHDELQLTNESVIYRDIHASKVIFCDGINSLQNPFFTLLPFAPNKGELLIAEIDVLPRSYILKYGLMIVPWKENLFWVGASNEWKFTDDQPTEIFRNRTIAQLNRILKVPFKIVDHWSALRPATLERRPFIGLHPSFPQLGIFNGMGTKGCSLAPHFAKQFTRHLLHGDPLLPEVDITRFRNILAKE